MDPKLDLIAALLPRSSRAERLRVAHAVELIELPAGAISGVIAPLGRWRALVLRGTVQTSNPDAEYDVGAVFEHGPATALIATTDVLLLVADTRSDALEQIAVDRRRVDALSRAPEVRKASVDQGDEGYVCAVTSHAPAPSRRPMPGS